MPHWLIKSAIQRTLSCLPKSQYWNDFFRKFGSRSLELSPEQFEVKLRESDRHWREFCLHYRGPTTNFKVLELGTGWFPTLPLGLFLCGAGEIWTVDIDSFLSQDRLQLLLNYFKEYNSSGRLHGLLPGARAERIDRLVSISANAASLTPAEWLLELNIHALVQDAQQLPLADRCVDLILSSAVLEYIPKPVLEKIMAEFRRVGRAGAVMTHRLNLVDVFSYFDRNITTLNYLRFTDRQWRWFNSPLIWQSRLRIPDYRRLYVDAGFEIAVEDNQRESPEKLERVPLAPQFQRYSREDLLVIHSFLVGRLREAGRTNPPGSDGSVRQ
jgi:hypothetical protein